MIGQRFFGMSKWNGRPSFCPGGGVKACEMFDRALKREILEELGLDILPANISSGSRKRIQEYLSNNFPIAKKW
jgi:hypothetical protein